MAAQNSYRPIGQAMRNRDIDFSRCVFDFGVAILDDIMFFVVGVRLVLGRDLATTTGFVLG